MKISGRSGIETGDDGFADPKQLVLIRSSDLEVVSGKAKQNELDGNKSRARLLETIVKSSKPGEVQADLARQYIGLRKDLRLVQQTLADAVVAFFHNLMEPKGAISCQVCGRGTTKPANMSQSRNPFYNQHHNTRIRGYASNAVPGVMCHVCNLVNIISSITETIPYYIHDKTTFILIPHVGNLSSLEDTIHLLNFPGVLVKSSDADIVTRSTNIKQARATNFQDNYIALITICYNMLNVWSENAADSDELPKEVNFGAITGWTIAPFAKGTNVNFRTFQFIPTSERLFYLLLSLPSEKEGHHNIYVDVFQRLSGEWVTQAARALVEDSRRNMALALIEWHSEIAKAGRTFHFYEYPAWKTMLVWLPHFLEGGSLLNKENLSQELREDLKALGYQLGSHFAGDVSYMTKLSTVRGTSEFQSLINHGFNVIYKITYAKFKQNASNVTPVGSVGLDEEVEEAGSEEESGLRYSPRRLERVLQEVTDQNVAEATNVLGSFASLYAIIRLQRDANGKKGDK